MLKPCMRRNSVSSPSALGELDAKKVHMSIKANIVSPSEVAELHDGRFLVIFVVVVTEDNARSRSPRKMARIGIGPPSINVNRI